MSDELRRRLVEEHGPGVFPEAFTKEGVMKEGWPKGAEAVSKNLDLLVEMDEPEQFVLAAVQATSGRPRWAKVHEALLELEKKLVAANEPSPKTATEEAPAT